jgi:pimeloyl-ACP methyl ester carboxylesterase
LIGSAVAGQMVARVLTKSTLHSYLRKRATATALTCLRRCLLAAIDGELTVSDIGAILTNTQSNDAPGWTDHYWWSADGIRLHCRIYGGVAGEGAVPLLCLPGLTRNARDFESFAPAFAADGPVAAVDFRGRGDSGFAKDPMTYVPLTYVQDVALLLSSLNWQRFAVIGTSLGGLVAMLLAGTMQGRFAGAVLNDVGPQLESAGLDRIRSYVGNASSQPTWLHAARQTADLNAAVYPDYHIQDWLRMVHRTHRLTPEGRIVVDYDKQIAAPFRLPGGEAGVDLWPAFDALAAKPLLIVRGAMSDILAADTAKDMQARAKDGALCTVARVGHAPTLDEPAARAAITAWRKKLVP